MAIAVFVVGAVAEVVAGDGAVPVGVVLARLVPVPVDDV